MKKWTEADEKQLTELRAQGKQYKEIAAIMGRTEKSVKAFAAYIVNHNRGSKRKPRQHMWTEAQDDLIITLRSKGHLFDDIAKQLGRHVTTVQNRYYSLLALDAGSEDWPPTKDPWPVKTNFAEHDLKLKPTRTVVKNTDYSGQRSLIGNSSAMCAK